MLDILSRLPARLLLLKALQKKEITVPGYTRHDGTYVPPHTKIVNYNPDTGAVLSGKSSHSHKEALKKLSKVKGFKELPAHEQHAHVMSSAQNIQTAASHSGNIAKWKKALLAGETPKPSLQASFDYLNEKDPQKAAKVAGEVTDAIGLDKYLELTGKQAPGQAAPSAPEDPAGPTEEEKAIAKDKLAEIAGKAKGAHYPYLAWKKLSDDVKVWASFKDPVAKLQAVVDLAKQLQDAATFSGTITNLTKKLAAGKVPSPSELAAWKKLTDNEQLKVAQNALKKGAESWGAIDDLIKQAAAKAGTDAPAPKAPEPVAKGHFGEQHEGQVVGAPGTSSKFKFEDGKWTYWTGEGWNAVKASEWLIALNEGQNPLIKKPLEVMPDPSTEQSFGAANPGKVFSDGKFEYKYEDGKWSLKGKAPTAPWFAVSSDQVTNQLNAGKGTYGPLTEVADEAPQPDDAWWIPGGGALTLQHGNTEVSVSYSSIDGKFTVSQTPHSGGAATSQEFVAPQRVQTYLQSLGIHPPEVQTMLDLGPPPEDDGPHEGDTKQGVGGLLTLKDGHWTLNNSEVVSFFHKYKIQPGTNMADAVVTNLKGMTKNGAGSVMADLVTFKKYAVMQGYPQSTINEMIGDLNGAYAKVLDEDPFGGAGLVSKEAAAPAASQYAYEHELHYTEGKSNKFWKVKVDPEAKTATTSWGKIGTKGASKTYPASSAFEAYSNAVQAAAAKAAKGYTTVSKVDGKATPAPKPKLSGFGPDHPGQIYEATLSTGKKTYFKYDADQNIWQSSANGTDWVKTTSLWSIALNKGEDINGNPVVPATEEKAVFETAKWAGKHFTLPTANGLIIFKFDKNAESWAYSTNKGETWTAVNPDAPLAIKLDAGEGANGETLIPYEDDGPHEGDMKPGAHGWLVLKDGHWVKASLDEALTKLCPIPDDCSFAMKKRLEAMIEHASPDHLISKMFKKVATKKNGLPRLNITVAAIGGLMGMKSAGYAKKGDDGKWVSALGQGNGSQTAAAMNWLEHAVAVQTAFLKNAKTIPQAPVGVPAAASATPKPATATPAPAAAPVAPAGPAGMESIDGWKKIGEQGGFNPGGTYTDPQGEDWYCKFPAGGAKVARNELLANKLYAAAGLAVPEVKLVTQGGKIGLASKIVTNATQDKTALQSGKGEGLLSGFVADAWLANWDVVGNNPAAGKGWDNILFKQGIAYRIDPGGALLYGGAGGKKTTFGDQVIELDTMRDANVNARTAKVFGKISQADLKASAAKVLEISDAKIEQMVQEFGPGDAAEKAALAKTLIARKADIAAKFPAVAKKIASEGPQIIYPHEMKEKKNKLDPTNLPVKPSDLPAPHDFMNWQGSGKPISEKPYVQQNIIDEKAIFDFAMKGNLVALKEYKYQPVDKMTGEPIGDPKPMDTHQSKYVKDFYDACVQYLEVVANPSAPLELPLGKKIKTIEQLSQSFPAFKYGKNISNVPSNHRLGFWFGLGFVDDWEALVPKTLKKPITPAAFAVGLANWNKAPAIMRSFLKAVKSAGSASQPYRDGKVTDKDGRNCRQVLNACYDHATEHEEGTTIYKQIEMPKSMIDEFLKQPPGLVFQNPGSMCCTRKSSPMKNFGEHTLIIHYAKGAKANDNMGWGTGYDGKDGKVDPEQEITSLSGARFMVMGRKMVHGHLELELLMLPPDPTYIADLKENPS